MLRVALLALAAAAATVGLAAAEGTCHEAGETGECCAVSSGGVQWRGGGACCLLVGCVCLERIDASLLPPFGRSQACRSVRGSAKCVLTATPTRCAAVCRSLWSATAACRAAPSSWTTPAGLAPTSTAALLSSAASLCRLRRRWPPPPPPPPPPPQAQAQAAPALSRPLAPPSFTETLTPTRSRSWRTLQHLLPARPRLRPLLQLPRLPQLLHLHRPLRLWLRLRRLLRPHPTLAAPATTSSPRLPGTSRPSTLPPSRLACTGRLLPPLRPRPRAPSRTTRPAPPTTRRGGISWTRTVRQCRRQR